MTIVNDNTIAIPNFIVVSNYPKDNKVVNWNYFTDDFRKEKNPNDVGCWKIKYKS